MKTFRSWLFVAFMVATGAIPQFAAAQRVQRMRIPAGVFSIPKTGGTVPALCLDSMRVPPTHADKLRAHVGSIEIARTVDGRREVKPLARARNDWGVELRGASEATGIFVDLPDGRARATWELIVKGEGAIVGADAKDVGKIRSVLTNSLRGRLRHFDAYRSKLHTAVGDGSVLLREYDAVVMRAQHEMVDEGADSVDASEIVKQFHARWFDAKNPSRALEVLAVTRGRAPSTAEAGALGVNTAVLRDSFAAELKVFSEVRGEAARYGGRTAAEQFESAVLAAFREGKDLRDSLAAGGKALAIAELDEIRYLADWRFAGDALRVLRSGTVDANAIKTIEKAIKVRYGPALPLDDVAFLRPSEPGKFLIAYSTSSEEVPLTAERVATLRNRRLVTMSLSASAAAELSSAGIRVVEDVEHLLAFPPAVGLAA